MFEVFEHTADLGLRIRTETREQLFVDAARAFFSILVANPDAVRPVVPRSFRVEGKEDDLLLFDWLSELLYVFDTERLLLVEFHVRAEPFGITANCRGEPVDPERHQLEHEVKAITYHELKVDRSEGAWTAEVILDI